MIDILDAERFSAIGDGPLCLIDLGHTAEAQAYATELAVMTQAVVVGLDRAGMLPPVDPTPFDALLTTAPQPPAPWASIAEARWDERIAGITATVARTPVAASSAMQILRMSGALPFRDALRMESFAYSALLAGEEFRRWRAAKSISPASADFGGSFVEITRENDRLTLRLARPAERNSFCAGMRDALFEALAAALDDPTRPAVRIEGTGPCFSTGGDLAEFGRARDLASAHIVRTLRSCADLIDRLGDRAEVLLHGACIGSGIEVPAAAHRRIGRPGAYFQLPEIGMGLMPGAGGTVTMPRAIGRHRTATMLLSAKRIDVATALHWGLIHAIEDAP